MARTDPMFHLRLPEDLLTEIKEQAERNGRTITAEMVQRLRTQAPAGYYVREGLAYYSSEARRILALAERLSVRRRRGLLAFLEGE